mmetsp:Transcript_19629/g.19725  ORF Transcript_19629/g.19725 Transcript_19629/m.19725 type:complete len:430 (+) Transcript_19629:154-1443(+)
MRHLPTVSLTFIIVILVTSTIVSVAFRPRLQKVLANRGVLHMSVKAMELWIRGSSEKSEDIDALVEKYAVDGVILDDNTDISKSVVNKLRNKNGKLYDTKQRLTGTIIEVDGGVAGQNTALSLVGSIEWIVLHCTGDWTMIPVENLVAACEGTGTKLAVIVDALEKLPGVGDALQLGPEAVVLSSDSSPSLWEAAFAMRADRLSSVASQGEISGSARSDPITVGPDIQVAEIVDIGTGGVADRVCVDLIQLLKPGEGVPVGSSSKLMALVHGETAQGQLVPARPFRVNAGPVHSYILLGDGSTKYLSELVPGDAVRVLNAEGPHSAGRVVTVGRCKIETRPTLLVKYRSMKGAGYGQIFLQQAETVRLISPTADTPPARMPDDNNLKDDVFSWRPLPVTEARVGDKILIVTNQSGTHVGKRISANVTEK